MLASSAVKAGDGDLFVAGGVESMSRAPYLLDALRAGNKYGPVQMHDALQTDGLWCSLCDWSMGSAAEFIGRQFDVTREEMDEFALRSHQLAAQATDGGKFKSEIAPVTLSAARATGSSTWTSRSAGTRRWMRCRSSNPLSTMRAASRQATRPA
jgi:acetyl-CoA C-acetyltransferase